MVHWIFGFLGCLGYFLSTFVKPYSFSILWQPVQSSSLIQIQSTQIPPFIGTGLFLFSIWCGITDNLTALLFLVIYISFFSADGDVQFIQSSKLFQANLKFVS